MIRRLVTRYWLLLPLLILAVVLLDRVEEPAIVKTEETIDMRQTQSDYYMSDFRTRKFGPDGGIDFIVDGKTLAHYPDDNRSEITAPQVELRRGDILWLARSDSGRFDPLPNLFTLQGDVTVKRLLRNNEDNAAPDAPSITISTQTLRIATEDNLVETDDRIQISAPSWRLEATGLSTAIDEGQLSLLADVVGRFQPPGISPQD
ncbi:MAG: LPS export ABC transporter periplasmic protein LptC [Granulosicoccus sp.]